MAKLKKVCKKCGSEVFDWELCQKHWLQWVDESTGEIDVKEDGCPALQEI